MAKSELIELAKKNGVKINTRDTINIIVQKLIDAGVNKNVITKATNAKKSPGSKSSPKSSPKSSSKSSSKSSPKNKRISPSTIIEGKEYNVIISDSKIENKVSDDVDKILSTDKKVEKGKLALNFLAKFKHNMRDFLDLPYSVKDNFYNTLYDFYLFDNFLGRLDKIYEEYNVMPAIKRLPNDRDIVKDIIKTKYIIDKEKRIIAVKKILAKMDDKQLLHYFKNLPNKERDNLLQELRPLNLLGYLLDAIYLKTIRKEIDTIQVNEKDIRQEMRERIRNIEKINKNTDKKIELIKILNIIEDKYSIDVILKFTKVESELYSTFLNQLGTFNLLKRFRDIINVKREEGTPKTVETKKLEKEKLEKELPKKTKLEEEKRRDIIQKAKKINFKVIDVTFPLKTKNLKINYEIFKELYKDKTFVSKLANSIKLFCEYKLKKYQIMKASVGLANNIPNMEEIKKIENALETKIKNLDNLSEDLYEVIYDTQKGMETLGGRENIKNTLASVIYAFAKNPNYLKNNFINFALYGKAGTGKTKIANIIAFIFRKCGIVSYDLPIIASVTDFVSENIGGTAILTAKTLVRSFERVLFIDEAYQIAPCTADGKLSKDSDKTLGVTNQSISEMVSFMDKNIGLYVTIVAGYENVMKNCYMKINEGLPRRFPNIIVLNDYSNEDLSKILIENILLAFVDEDIKLSDKIMNYIYSIIVNLNESNPNIFSNQAGDMINLSNNIIKSISSAYAIEWINNDFENNVIFINDGFSDFVAVKNIL